MNSQPGAGAPRDALASWDVEFACDLANSWDVTLRPQAPERFADRADYQAYLTMNGRQSELDAVTEADVVRLRELRGAVRAVFELSPSEAVRVVSGLLERHVAGIELDDGDPPQLAARPAMAGYAGAVAARTAFALAQVAAAGQLGRLRSCARQGCEWVLVDVTRPGNRRFCCPQCTARVSTAAYRARQETSRA